ncbi:MAG: head GIN domain-containing protein, partial [Bacteroidota bacterium]
EMKKIVFTLLALCCGAVIFAQQINDPNAEIREAKNFHAIKVSHAFDVYLTQSNEEAVAVSAADDEAKQHIKVQVDGGVLIISFDADKQFWKAWKGNKKLKAYISFKSIDKLLASGACDFKIMVSIKAENLVVDFSGASDLKGKVEVDNTLDVQLSGASDVDINGTASQLKASLSGACDFKGYDLVTEYCDISASGASGVKITVNKELSAKVSGASDINYKGTGLIRDLKSSGASSIKKRS